MGAILKLLQAALAALSSMQGILSGVQTVQEKQATSVQALTIISRTNAILDLLLDETIGLEIINTKLDNLSIQSNAAREAIIDAINGLPQVGDPVTLPTPAPTGYGGSGSSLTAEEVWIYPLGAGPVQAGDLLDAAATSVNFRSVIAEPARNSYKPSWFGGGDWGYSGQAEPNVNDIPATPNVGTILSSDGSIQAWVERVYGVDVYTFSPDGWVQFQPVGTNWLWTYDLSPAQFEAIRAARAVVAPDLLQVPLWPGLAKVTLGENTEMGESGYRDGAMHGVLINLSSWPSTRPSLSVGGIQMPRYIGRVAFATDAGFYSAAIPIAVEDQVIMVREMEFATHVVFQLYPGVVAQIQPFTIDSLMP